jgi:hypothetical protein
MQFLPTHNKNPNQARCGGACALRIEFTKSVFSSYLLSFSRNITSLIGGFPLCGGLNRFQQVAWAINLLAPRILRQFGISYGWVAARFFDFQKVVVHVGFKAGNNLDHAGFFVYAN